MERTLAGHLAHTGWITRHGEPLSTVGLAYLLEQPALSDAVTSLVATRASTELPSPLFWEPEAQQEDRGRPDLEGRHNGVPIVKIEAKYGALLSTDQLRSYEADQMSKVAPDDAAVLAVLVPEERAADAADLLTSIYGSRGPDRYWTVSSAQRAVVVSWGEVLDALEPALPGEATACDFRQLRGLVTALGGLGVAPLSLSDLGPEWEEQRANYEAIVDRLTRLLTPGDVMPIGTEYTGYRRRYVLTAADASTYYAIGLRPPPAGTVTTPIWLRFHSETPGFGEVRKELSRSELAPELVEEGGHLWYALVPPVGPGGSQLIGDLAEQVRTVLRVSGWTRP